MRKITILICPNVTYVVGKHGVTRIIEHSAKGEGDKWYYDLHYKDKSMLRVFDFSEVKFDLEIPDPNPLPF